MKCPKCDSPLESSTGEERVFKLQYGKRYEPTYVCSVGCPGLWTETSIGLYQEMIQRERKKRKAILEEQPAPTGKGGISVPIVDKAQPYGFGVGRFMEPLKTKKKGGDKDAKNKS